MPEIPIQFGSEIPPPLPPGGRFLRMLNEDAVTNDLVRDFIAPTGGVTCVTAMDFTATGSSPTQVRWQAKVALSAIVMYDSQSTGEGLGVYYPWRGLVVMHPGEDLRLEGHIISGVSPIVFGLHASGFFYPDANPI